jgi:ParB family chromosome partitioning protein
VELTSIPLAQLAPHPHNPRQELGDLSDLRTSVQKVGVLEPLVITTRQAHLQAWPEDADVLDPEATHVTILGHRRRRAALDSELVDVPVQLREDLSADRRDYDAMLAENGPGRQPLNPMEEAVGFRTLVELGRSQDDIASSTGYAQSTISKRIALLNLAPALQAAVRDTSEQGLGARDAYTLVTKLRDEDDQCAAWDLMRGKPKGERPSVAEAIAEVRRRAAAAQVQVQSISTQQAPGEVLAPVPTLGGHGDSLVPAAGASADREGNERNGAADRERGSGPAQAAPAAAAEPIVDPGDTQAREDACARLVARKPEATPTLRLLAAHVVRTASATDLRLAFQWLRAAGIGPDTRSAVEYRTHVLASSADLVTRLARAIVLAHGELVAQRDADWNATAIEHVQRLMVEAEYQPAQWEVDRLPDSIAS